MRKNKKKIEEPISGPGWTAYGEDSGNYDLEDFFEDEVDEDFDFCPIEDCWLFALLPAATLRDFLVCRLPPLMWLA